MVFLLLPEVASEAHTFMCSMIDPIQKPHEYYQAGDVTIGGMTSQLFSFVETLSFERHPKSSLIDENV